MASEKLWLVWLVDTPLFLHQLNELNQSFPILKNSKNVSSRSLSYDLSSHFWTTNKFKNCISRISLGKGKGAIRGQYQKLNFVGDFSWGNTVLCQNLKENKLWIIIIRGGGQNLFLFFYQFFYFLSWTLLSISSQTDKTKIRGILLDSK